LDSPRSAAGRLQACALLQAADVWFGYDPASPVLRGASVAVPYGGFVGILGPNGSGKTTLLRLLAGTRRPSRGRVTLDGAELSHLPRAAIARRMAVVPQETHLAFDYTALEIVLMGRYPHLGAFEVEGPDDVAIARQSLDATGTLALQDRLFSTLSGGEKQRVVIASALAQIGKPGAAAAASNSVLLLDEPTAALDLAYQLEVASLLRELQERLPIAMVVSTHDLNFAASLCRTIVLLKAGQVLASGPTDDVITPASIRELYGVDADVERRSSTGRLVVVPVGRTETRDTR
jgi:cobalamin transport system ATP-binding protein